MVSFRAVVNCKLASAGDLRIGSSKENVLSYWEPSACPPEPVMSEVIHVGIGVLVAWRGTGGCRVLIARRPGGAVLEGYWELPGGKVDPDESVPQCVAREFREELGIQIAVGEPLEACDHTYPHGMVRLHPYYCRLLAGEPRNLQVAEFRWVPPGELMAYRFPPANGVLIRTVVEDLTPGDEKAHCP